jgi:hypothetical protein
MLMNLKDIGFGCLVFVIPIALMVITAILAKKYLFGDKMPFSGGKKK